MSAGDAAALLVPAVVAFVLTLLAVSGVFGSVALLLTALPKQVALSVTVILGSTSFAALAGLVRLERRQVRSDRAVRCPTRT